MLRAAHTLDPSAISDVITKGAHDIGAADVVIYLVDFAQNALEPLPDRNTHADLPKSEDVAATMAGRAFAGQCATWSERQGGVRMWVPILEGSDRTGVLGVTVPRVSDE